MRNLVAACVSLGISVAAVSAVMAEDVTGRWQCVEYTRGGEGVPMMAAQGSLQLNADNTYVQTISPGVQETGTYAIAGTEITLSKRGKVRFQGSIEDGTITLEFKPTWTKIVYKKASDEHS